MEMAECPTVPGRPSSGRFVLGRDGDREARERWRSPGGIGAVATVAGVVVAVIAIFVSRGGGGNDSPSAPAARETYLFVYGTTMPGHVRYPLIQEFVAETTPDRVSGQLFDSGLGYPVAKFGSGQGMIEGYLLWLRREYAAEAKRTFTQIESGLSSQYLSKPKPA
jgi:hypothetical protein